MKISEIRNRILDIYGEQEKLDEELKTKIEKLQTQCDHSSVIETSYKPSASGLFSAMSPARICVICSLEEEGWGCGYNKLRQSTVLKVVERNEFYKYRKLQPLQTKKIEIPNDLVL